MVKRKSKSLRINKFFTPPGHHNPIGNILTEGANILTEYAFQRYSREVAKLFGVLGASTTETTRAEMLSERQLKMYDLKIQEKELDIERAQRQLDNALARDPSSTLQAEPAVVCGALETTADPKGLVSTPGQSEGYNRWLDGFQEGKIVLVSGRRGSGKTALIAKMAEYMAATYQMPTYWLGLPDEGKRLVPRWITLVDDAHKCPVNSFIVCDEAGINFLSLLFQDKRNQFMRRLMMVCRQRHCSLAFAVQNTRDVDLSIARQSDSLIFKRPGLHQAETERIDIRPLAKKAALAFEGMSPEESLESAYVFDDDFSGIIKFSPPSFWTEELSHVYAHLDLTAIEKEAETRKALRNTVAEASHQLNEASLDSKILELRKDHGIDAITRILGCSQYRVRKCLDGIDGRIP